MGELVVRAAQFDEPVRIEVPVHGMTVEALLEATTIPRELWPQIYVLHHGIPLPMDYVTQPGDELAICVEVQGGGGNNSGKQILAAIAMIIVAIYAPQVAAAIGGQAFAVGTTANAVAAAAITMVAGLAISAMVKPPSMNSSFASSRRSSMIRNIRSVSPILTRRAFLYCSLVRSFLNANSDSPLIIASGVFNSWATWVLNS